MLDKGSEEWKLFADIWRLYKKYYEPADKSKQGIEKHVDEMINEVSEVITPYQGTKNDVLSTKLMAAIFDDFSFRSKEWVSRDRHE